MAKTTTTTKTTKSNGSFTCVMKKDRDTKGTYVYHQITEDGADFSVEAGAQIPSVYIRKSAFGDGAAPDRITVTVAEG
jgi:hypothetical protein